MANPKITKIEITQCFWEIQDCGSGEDDPMVTYRPGARHRMSLYMTRMYTDAGIVGEYPLRNDISNFGEYLLGKDAFAREQVYQDFRSFPGSGRGGVDILLWDIAGKALGQPISALLGGHRTRLPAYASTMNGGVVGLDGGLSDAKSFGDFAEQCLELGYKGFKIHPFTRYKVQDHVDAVLELGRRVGGKMDLMLDSYCLYPTFADALKVARACDEAGFYWIEDLYFEGGISEEGHRRLKEFVKTPLLQGEKVVGLQAKMNLLLSGATDFVRGLIPQDGITGTMKLAAAAEAVGADVEIHGCGPAQRHGMSAMANSNYYEIVWVHPDVECLQTTPEIYADYDDSLTAIDSDGCVSVPTGPGMGVEWNWDAINRMSAGTKVIE